MEGIIRFLLQPKNGTGPFPGTLKLNCDCKKLCAKTIIVTSCQQNSSNQIDQINGKIQVK